MAPGPSTRRFEPYDTLIDHLHEHGTEDPRLEPILRRTRADLQRRRRDHDLALRRMQHGSSLAVTVIAGLGSPYLGFEPRLLRPRNLVLIVAALLLAIALYRLLHIWGVLALFGFVLIIGAYCDVSRSRLRRSRAAGYDSCDACGYDLAGCPSAIPPELLDGHDLGPRRCPECGRHWPLAPEIATIPAS